ncbi:hypothetical protein [Tsukamurella sputi]|nr:hypothetical protein [Tsukamurella sputi]
MSEQERMTAAQIEHELTTYAATTLMVTADALGVGRTHMYAAARKACNNAEGRGVLAAGVPVMKIGSRYSVPTAPLRAALGLGVAA